MFTTVLRWLSLAASFVLILSFLAFAADEARKGSNTQLEKLEATANRPDPTERGERLRERKHGAPRELVDDANDALVKPFASLTEDEGLWVQRIVSGLLGLLLYGLGGGLLANYLARPRRAAVDPFSGTP